MSSDASGSGAAKHQSRYIIERTLGRGGMATVYLARDGELDRLVALKVLSPHLAEEESFRARFLREARLTARLVHANVVQVYDVGEDERGPFIVMEYVEGETLAAELARRRTFAPEEAVGLALQLCAGLEAAHAAGLVHRDIKPHNVLLRRDGVAKIVDFGIARAIDTTLHTEQGAILGTAAYLAPEQARGEPVTAVADLYALGIVLYELLTGRRPFAAETLPALVLEREQGLIVPLRARAAAIPPHSRTLSCTASSGGPKPDQPLPPRWQKSCLPLSRAPRTSRRCSRSARARLRYYPARRQGACGPCPQTGGACRPGFAPGGGERRYWPARSPLQRSSP